MIDKVLGLVKEEINTALSHAGVADEHLGVVSGLVASDGSPVKNRIVISLANIEREDSISPRLQHYAPAGQQGNFQVAYPSLALNLHILISSNFDNYETSLNRLSKVISFLQSKPVFNGQNSTHFPGELEKLTMEIVNMSFQDMSFMWGMVDGSYVPSVVYKMRMLIIQEDRITQTVPAVTRPDSHTTSS